MRVERSCRGNADGAPLEVALYGPDGQELREPWYRRMTARFVTRHIDVVNEEPIVFPRVSTRATVWHVGLFVPGGPQLGKGPLVCEIVASPGEPLTFDTGALVIQPTTPD